MKQPPYFERDFTLEFCRELVTKHGNIQNAAKAIAHLCAGGRLGTTVVSWSSVAKWITKQCGPRRHATSGHVVILYKGEPLTKEIATNLVAEYGTITAAGTAAYPDCTTVLGQPLSEKTIRMALGRIANRAPGMELAEPFDPEKINRVAELLQRANIDPDAIGFIDKTRLKSWGYSMKLADAEGNEQAHEGGLYATDISLRPAAPDFPLIQPTPTTTINFAPAIRILRKTRTEMVVSDIQAGFLRDVRTDALEPIHDPDAIDVAYQICADIRPKRLIFIGDLADLSSFSRWTQHAEYRGTLQQSIDVVHEICGTFIANSGKGVESIVIGSNHDHRIEKSVLEWNKEAMGLRRAHITDGWPVFSLGYLARFDDLNLQWSGQYPGGEFYILPDLIAMHAPPKSKEFGGCSVVHGHLHKITRHTHVTHTFEGRKTSFVYDCGCLCKVGVTSDKFRLLVTQTPSDRGRTDWANGVIAINIVEASGSQKAVHSVDQISIIDGQAIYGGRVYRSRHLPSEEAA